MNYLAYILFFILSCLLTINVGKQLFKHGQVYIDLFFLDKNISIATNKILLAGYYLINISHLIFTFTDIKILNFRESIYFVFQNTGRISLTLGIIHFFNLFILKQLSHYINSK